MTSLIEDLVPDELWRWWNRCCPLRWGCSADDDGWHAEDGLASPNGLIRGGGITRLLRW
jgi:hypothetical protein